MKPVIEIEYRPACGWMFRATYTAQQLLTILSDDVKGVLLTPPGITGPYTLRINEALIFD